MNLLVSQIIILTHSGIPETCPREGTLAFVKPKVPFRGEGQPSILTHQPSTRREPAFGPALTTEKMAVDSNSRDSIGI